MALRKIAEETRAAIALIHHSNRGGSYRGSSAISGAVDLMLKVESKPESSIVEMSTEKVRDVEPFDLNAHIRFSDLPFRVHLSKADPVDKPPKLSAGEEYVLRYLRENGASTVAEIKDHADSCAPTTARKGVYSLVQKGMLQRVDEGGAGEDATYDLVQKPVPEFC